MKPRRYLTLTCSCGHTWRQLVIGTKLRRVLCPSCSNIVVIVRKGSYLWSV